MTPQELSQQLQERNATFSQRAADARTPKEEKPAGAFDMFTSDVPDRPTPDLLHGAIAAADRIGRLVHPQYHAVRDDVVAFTMHWRPDSPLDNAIARLCVPLVGYAKLLGYLTIVAKHGDQYAAAGVKPGELRFADVEPIGQHVQGYFLAALRLADPDAHLRYVDFVAGTSSEEALDGELLKHVKPVQAALLTQAAACLKDGIRAVHSGIAGGARSTDDLIPPPQQSRQQHMQDLADQVGGIHVSADGTTDADKFNAAHSEPPAGTPEEPNNASG